LVFFHGYGSNKECFLPLINYFSSFYRVTAFDFPGFGCGEKLSSAFSVSDYAAWTRNFLHSVGVSSPHIIAHSFGARVAVKLALKEPLGKIVITGGAGIIEGRGAAYKLKVKGYRLVKRFFPSFAERSFGSAEYKRLSPIMRESYKKIVNEDLRRDAERVKNDVLLIYGGGDKTTPVSEGKIYDGHFPHSRLAVMEGCGHFAFLDDPLGFRILTEDFLE